MTTSNVSHDKFNEATRVQLPALIHLNRLGFSYFGKISEEMANTTYDPETNILLDVFRRQFALLNPSSAGDVEQVLKSIRQELDNDDLGRNFYKRLTAVSPVRLIDFDNIKNNVFHCTAEFTCKRDQDEFRPDITLFVNGLPLVFIEVKKPNNHGGMVAESARMNKQRFPNKKFRRFVNITQLMIFSNNMEYDTMGGIVPIQGAFYCTAAREKAPFNCFREENPTKSSVAPFIAHYPYKEIDTTVEKKILSDFNCQVIHTAPEYQTNLDKNTPTNRIITSMCSPERLLFLIKYGIAYVKSEREVDGTIEVTDQKHIMRYQQMFAALAIRQKISEGITSGVVWHTQGSGKTALSYHLTYVSPSVEKLLGESIEEHMYRKMDEKFSAQTLHKIQSVFYEELEKEKDPQIDKNRSRTFEIEHYKTDGTVIWLELNVSFIRDDNGNAIGFQGSSREITKRKLAEIALEESEHSKSVLLSNLQGMAYRYSRNPSWMMQFVSDGSIALTGYAPENFVNSKDFLLKDLIAPEYREVILYDWEQVIANRGSFSSEYEIITASGERKWVIGMAKTTNDEHGEVDAVEGIILDISDRKEMENRLKYQNEHDNWTGLYNRDYLEVLLNNDIKKKDGLKRAVISINLSTVQLLTANYGFHYTQNLIKTAAETLSQYCSDTRLLCQTYENRFVFYFINYKDKNELVEFSDIIAESLEALFVTDRIDGGIGILEIEQDNDEIDVNLLLRRLLIASERSIAVSEKDFEACFYNEELEAAVNREGDIRKALGGIAVENTNDELFLHYQPILDLRTNGVCGFEALARLKTEKLGLVSPVEFIPIAEKTKMIIPIGEKVMINAFHFLNKLKASGYDEVGVAINVSAIQLFSPDFIRNLFELISEMQLNPKNIGIEITESVFVSDYDYINSIIVKLRDTGIHIAIDDFGTGYSSLAREKELSVDCLKIDKYFIDKLLETDLSKAITSDIISMSHKLGHCTIAEGVEYESQLQYLKEHSCDRIQGYLFSKPLNEEDALEFLKSKNKYDCHSNDSLD